MPEPAAPLSEEAAKDEAQRLIADAYAPTSFRINDPAIPSWEDGSRVGTTPPVPQPDSRIVPRWALGLAVGSIGVGAGSVGLGCAIWLASKGLSSVIHSLASVTLPGVLAVAVPFAGAAMLATAIGGMISKAKKAALPDVHVYNGPVRQETRVDQRKSVWQKNITKS
jgi:hypothetical protein